MADQPTSAKPVSRDSYKARAETQALIESDLAKYKATQARLKRRKRKPIRIRSGDRAADEAATYADNAVRNLERNLTRVKASGSTPAKPKAK